MNIASLLFVVARRLHQAPAVSSDKVTYSYGEWIDRVARLAGAMRATGAVPGDRVILWMENCTEFPLNCFSVLDSRPAAVPVNAKLHEREIGYIAKNSASKLIFCSPGYISRTSKRSFLIQACSSS